MSLLCCNNFLCNGKQFQEHLAEQYFPVLCLFRQHGNKKTESCSQNIENFQVVWWFSNCKRKLIIWKSCGLQLWGTTVAYMVVFSGIFIVTVPARCFMEGMQVWSQHGLVPRSTLTRFVVQLHCSGLRIMNSEISYRYCKLTSSAWLTFHLGHSSL